MVTYLTSVPAQECVDSRPELRTFRIVLVSEKQEAVSLPPLTVTPSKAHTRRASPVTPRICPSREVIFLVVLCLQV